MTVIPLFCSRFLKAVPHMPEHTKKEGEYDLEPTELADPGWIASTTASTICLISSWTSMNLGPAGAAASGLTVACWWAFSL